MYIGNDNVASFVGYVSYEYIPTVVDFSYPIINDMDIYDFTDGQIFYYRNYAFVSVPKSGLIRVYNMTDQTKDQFSQYKAIEDVTQMPWFWEAPITYPIAGFYVADGVLYGHGYNTSESYQLFTGGSFNGQNIEALAYFAFDDSGDRTQSKGSNEIWVDGYIKQNTVLTVGIGEDLDAFRTTQTVTVNGSDNTIVAYGGGGHSLGEGPLGSLPLGGSNITIVPPVVTEISVSTLPAYFHVIKTYTQNSYYLEQVFFYTNGVDLQWEIIAFGTNKEFTTEGNNSITQ